MTRRPPRSTLFPYTTLVRAARHVALPSRGAVLDPCRRGAGGRSEEHTSELQSRQYIVCRLLREKKKTERSRGTRSHSSTICPPQSRMTRPSVLPALDRSRRLGSATDRARALFALTLPRPPRSTLLPYTTLFR